MRESKEAIRDAINRIATYLGLTFALSAVFYGLVISADARQPQPVHPTGV
jgi:hypothetical protein